MNDTTQRHCHGCKTSGETTRLTRRDYCHTCAARIDSEHLYFRIPKVFTIRGLRTQANGVLCFLQAARGAAAGETIAARKHGRLGGVKLAARFWIENWYVLESAGWRR